MENLPASFQLWMIEAGIMALVAWVWMLWRSHMNHKLHVAENYVRHPEIQELKQMMKDAQTSSNDILKIVHELKGRAQGQSQP